MKIKNSAAYEDVKAIADVVKERLGWRNVMVCSPNAKDVQTIIIARHKNKMLICSDCNGALVKSHIECSDGSGWMSGYLCDCEYSPQPGERGE